MNKNIRLWHWPNILAIDAALVALAWQWVFSKASDSRLTLGAYSVLGISVWLTYMADRLFDVRNRRPQQLLSLRHAFAKRHSAKIWTLWWIALLLDIALAMTTLSGSQITYGLYLLISCLLYTLLHQKCTPHFFPKEVCVALIYAGGVVVFQESPFDTWSGILSFAAICLINCLMISLKERDVDRALGVKTLSKFINRKSLWPLFLLTLLASGKTTGILQFSIVLTLIMLATLQSLLKKFCVEDFRSLADGALLLGVIASATLSYLLA